jgi:hypothetical protein
MIPSSGKLYHHKMKVPHLQADSDVAQTATALMQKHATYLTSPRISSGQLERTLRFLRLF